MKSSMIVNGKLIEENISYNGNKRMGCYFYDDLFKNEPLKNITNRIIELSNNLNPFKGLYYTGVPKYSFNRYGEGDFLEWHSDKHEILDGATITFIIQLNDDYDGGDVKYITDRTKHITPKKTGSVLIFDSNIIHSVDEVIKGTRYSLNVWPSKTIKQSIL
jgi:predicted 2-oxoglutarate/Fe(II)-dependent dioxygenase YbiX